MVSGMVGWRTGGGDSLVTFFGKRHEHCYCMYALINFSPHTHADMSIDDVRQYELEMQKDTNSRVLDGVDFQDTYTTTQTAASSSS